MYVLDTDHFLKKLFVISAQEKSLLFPSLTADTAYQFGTNLYNRLRSCSTTPCVINITLTNSSQLLYHACSHPGTTPDNATWVARKRATVLRWGCSSWYASKEFGSNEFKANQEDFTAKYTLGEAASKYAIRGGGVAIRVQGVEGVVAVCVVSGLKQHEDHGVVVEQMENLIEDLT